MCHPGSRVCLHSGFQGLCFSATSCSSLHEAAGVWDWREKNNCMWGKPAQRFPVLLHWGCNARKGGKMWSWARSSPKSEEFSDDRVRIENSCLKEFSNLPIFKSSNLEDLHNPQMQRSASPWQRSCSQLLLSLKWGCFTPSVCQNHSWFQGRRHFRREVGVNLFYYSRCELKKCLLAFWLLEEVLPNISSAHRRSLQWQNLVWNLMWKELSASCFSLKQSC